MITLFFDTAATVAAVALAVVFTTAAFFKVRSLPRTVDEFAALGLGRSKAAPVAVAAAEIGVAITLLFQPPLGALAAGLLLGAFTGFVTWALAADKQVSCGCFGPLNKEPVSAATVWRNLVLLVLAGLAGMRGSLAAPDLAATVVLSTAALMVAVAVQAALTARRLGRLWSVELAGEMSRQSIFQTGRSEE